MVMTMSFSCVPVADDVSLIMIVTMYFVVPVKIKLTMVVTWDVIGNKEIMWALTSGHHGISELDIMVSPQYRPWDFASSSEEMMRTK